MSLILKSNVASTAQNLIAYELLTMTPQEYYDSFVARVAADGGEIVNPTKLKDTIDFLFDKKLVGKLNTLVGADYAVKRSGGQISKVYGVVGLDFDVVKFGSGQSPLLNTTDVSKPYIDMRNAGISYNNGTLLKSNKSIVQSRSQKLGFSLVMQDAANINGIIAQALDSDNPEAAMPLWVAGSKSLNIQGGVSPTPYIASTPQVNISLGHWSEFVGKEPVHFIADASKVSLTTYKNGAEATSYPRPVPKALAEVKSPITIGGYQTFSSRGLSASNFHEIWLYNNIVDNEILLVDDFLRAKYI